MDKQVLESIELYALCVNNNGSDGYLYKKNKRDSDQVCMYKNFDDAMREYSFIKLNLWTVDINSDDYKMLTSLKVVKIKTEVLKVIE